MVVAMMMMMTISDLKEYQRDTTASNHRKMIAMIRQNCIQLLDRSYLRGMIERV